MTLPFQASFCTVARNAIIKTNDKTIMTAISLQKVCKPVKFFPFSFIKFSYDV